MPLADPTNNDLKAALVSAIHHHGNQWRRFVVRILGNETDAEDVLQEAIRRVLIRNRYFPSEEQVKMYLGRAISNMAIEMYNNKKRQRRRHYPLREHTLPLTGIASPHTYLEERERAGQKERLLRLLNEGLTQLPLKQYEALRLTILDSDGQSMRDAGVTNGIPYSTLRHRSRQGIRRLRKFLQQSMRSLPLKSVK